MRYAWLFVAAAAARASWPGGVAGAGRPEALGPEVQKYVKVGAQRVVLTHVEVIDGTGGPPVLDRNVTLENGVIVGISEGSDEPQKEGTTLLDLRGHAVIPGIVGMHDHLFYLARPGLGPDGAFDRPGLFHQLTFSAPRLYLANGVTTIRTTGSVEPITDLNLKQAIDAGVVPGPHVDVTGPYLNAGGNPNLQMQQLRGPEDARETVAYWAGRGVTSFKAYADITRAALGAAVVEAHKHGIKVTGHLCSVTYPEAVELGIDNLEHGFQANTALDPDKKPDTCSESRGDYTLEHMTDAQGDALIALLVGHHVAVTSTLPGLAASVVDSPIATRPLLRPAVLEAMAPAVRDAYLFARNNAKAADPQAALLLRKDMALQRAFVEKGGLLLAGSDPVGVNGLLPGFADHREIELLVQAGFPPVEAIRIATLNGATFLGRQDRIGSIAQGKNADLVVVKGDPASRIDDLENVVLVFKDGLGYDPRKLLESVRGRYGEY
jgi:imidazolonepropionase-like amidohydrolase